MSCGGWLIPAACARTALYFLPLLPSMKRGRTRVILVGMGIVCAGNAPLAAECLAPPPPCVALNNADMVFHGRVVSATWVTPESTADGTRVTFDVLRAFKGISGKTYTGVFDERNAESFRFFEGMVVIVYARNAGTAWQTACSRTVGFPSGEPTRAKAQALEDEVAQLGTCSSASSPK